MRCLLKSIVCCNLLLATLLPNVGCDGGPGATVQGQVTLDGVPLEKGAISFASADGATATAGGPIENGAYLVVLPPGAKKVSITATKVVGQRAAYAGDPNSPQIDITESIIPPRYNKQTELTFDVQPGANEKNFELEGEAKPKR